MKIIIPGGSGQIGTMLARHFHRGGNEVNVLSRRPVPAPWRVIEWDARTEGPWIAALNGADVVINLAGKSVDCRYHPDNRRQIINSRVQSTQAIGKAIQGMARPPRVWLQAGTATIYSHRFDAANDDATGIIGGTEPNVPDTWRFSIEVAKAWEGACNAINTPQTRKVIMRSAMTMSPDAGGVFDVLLRLVRLRLGGASGSGRQFVSWIHERDFIAAIEFMIVREDLDGCINLSSPKPLPNSEFMAALRAAWRVSLGLPATNWMLEIGAWVLRTETELILKSRRVVPLRLLDAGFEFTFPDWQAAAIELCDRWRRKSL